MTAILGGFMTIFEEQDLDAGIDANIIDSGQKAALLNLARQRGDARLALAREDEPFELFQGFSEVFISIGLLILGVGIVGAVETVIAEGLSPFVLILFSFICAHYYIKRRRMTLPSILSMTSFAVSFGFLVTVILAVDGPDDMTAGQLLATSMILFAVLVIMFRFYRLPFIMLLTGLTGLSIVLALARLIVGDQSFDIFNEDFFDLRQNAHAAVAWLIFGLCAFMAAMWFDLRDPYRISTASKTAFWLHILAGPPVINTIAMTLFNFGGATGYILTAGMLLLVALLSLLIDRRSFLTAGLIYIAAVIGLVTDGLGDVGTYANALILGVLITVMGTWWLPLRSWIMRLLPAFPGKNRLPPYHAA